MSINRDKKIRSRNRNRKGRRRSSLLKGGAGLKPIRKSLEVFLLATISLASFWLRNAYAA
jgi:hypothetical protein